MAGEPSNQSTRDGYKSWFDLSVLVIAHVLLLPLWLLLWTIIPILILLGDRGPVIYKQDRVGKGGRIFTVFKFRTMIADAEDKGAAWTMDQDPRVTKVGKLLRRTALDELPEVLNIWKGDMSFVGPRALDVEEQRSLEKLIAGFEGRLQVRPGLTGLAQIYDPKDDAHEKFHYDLEYLQRMSPWLDVKLLILSVRNTLWVKWDRRSGKTSFTDVIPDSPSKDARQQGTSREEHTETNGSH
jgi:lipopolysaccharide/colanic/teichoic acid biosynthesis glycosyltransferase